MIKYTSEDVKALAVELTHFFTVAGPQENPDNNVKFWLEVVDEIKKEYSEIKEVILELLGPSVFSFTREFSKHIGLTDLIFNTPVKLMPLYIGSNDRPWEMVVARWRLTIQK